MPQMKREMSWLSPRRRRTTGNLKTDANGKISGESTRTSASRSATSERPSNAPRTLSQPAGTNADTDGNLFYAYARKGDDLHCRYLLTFASASIANEWWLLLQLHFPGTSRPGPQLFSFKEDDLLSQAWQHPSFSHLKSKWMYISFSDASGGGVGGAAQGIIPVQDAEGNILGGSASNIEGILPELKEETQEVIRSEVSRLEEYVSNMMEALQRNTEKAAELAAKIQAPRSTSREVDATHEKRVSSASNGGGFDLESFSMHFGELNQSLTKNSQAVEKLAEQHSENEQRLRETLDALSSNRNDDSLDMQQLSSHLDRIQSMMEESAKERQDSARDISERPQQIDFSPLTERLEKVQEAVEQNSALIKALLDEGTGGADANQHPLQIDLGPLQESLERIYSAVEQQSQHTKALVGFASGDGEGDESGTSPDRNLAPLSEHLEQIYNAIEEGNTRTREMQQKLELEPLRRHLEVLQEYGEKANMHREQLLESQDAVRGAIEANGNKLDFTPLADHLAAIHESTNANSAALKHSIEAVVEQSGREIDFTPLTQHLEAIHNATEKNAEALRDFASSRQASAAESDEGVGTDFSPLTDRLDNIHTALEKQMEQRDEKAEPGDTELVRDAVNEHLSKIQRVTEQNAAHVKALSEKQSTSTNQMRAAVSETSEQVRKLIERNKENENKIDAQNSQMRELMSGQREMVEVMRQLAKSIAAQNKDSCSHVVVPPPRKMNRKLVGFVYDTKEGTA